MFKRLKVQKLIGCKDTLFFAFMQEGVPKNRQEFAKIPTLHVEIPNLDIGRGGNMCTFSHFFWCKTGNFVYNFTNFCNKICMFQNKAVSLQANF